MASRPISKADFESGSVIGRPIHSENFWLIDHVTSLIPSMDSSKYLWLGNIIELLRGKSIFYVVL